jgi:hypothetical protein
LDDENVEEPIVIGTRMSVLDASEDFPYTADYDDPYFWFLKTANSDSSDKVAVIDVPQDVYEKETRDLGRILTFATPLLEIKNSDQLRDKFVAKLLSLHQ